MDQIVIEPVGLAMDSLNPRGIVDVRHGRNVRSRNAEFLGTKEALLFLRHRSPAAFHHGRDQEHVRTVAVELEPVRYILPQYGWRERAKRLSVFDFEIQYRLHFRRSRIG